VKPCKAVFFRAYHYETEAFLVFIPIFIGLPIAVSPENFSYAKSRPKFLVKYTIYAVTAQIAYVYSIAYVLS